MEVRKLNWFLPVFLAAYVILNIAAGIFIGIAPELGIALPDWIVYVISEVMAFIIVLIYMLVMKINIRRDMQYKVIGGKDIFMSLPAMKDLLEAGVTGVLILPMVLFLNAFTMLFSDNYIQESSQGLLEYPYIAQLILIAVIPPLVEEFIFRGLFFGTYRKCGVLKAALMSGLVFGMFHLNINQFAYALVSGVIFAYMVEATGSIWSSVIAHFVVNSYSITINQILKLSGLYSAVNDTATGTQDELTSITMSSRLAGIFMMFVIGAVFMLLAVLCIRNMAKRNGRLEVIRESFRIGHKKGSYNNSSSEGASGNGELLSADNMSGDGEVLSDTAARSNHVLTAPAVASVAACLVYMIIMEMA